MSLNVWTSYYDCKDELHQTEILRAIELNTANPNIDTIYLLCEVEYPVLNTKVKCIKIKEQPTYATFIDYFQVFCRGDYNVIINSDIVLDYDTTDLCRSVPEGTVYALARYEVDYKTYKEPIETWKSTLHYFPHYSQDAWIFYKSKLDTSTLNIYVGAQESNNLIAYFLESQNLKITNPSLSIKIYHLHSSEIRNYTKKYNYKNNSLFVTATRLEDYKSTIYTKWFNGKETHHTYNSDNIKNILDIAYNPPKNNSVIDYMYGRPKYNDLAVGLVFFNPVKSRRILMNYLYTVEKLKLAKIPYYTMELVYNGRNSEIADAFHVRAKSYMFHKENLCYLLEKRIPKYYTKLLFLDADVVFSDPDWYNKLSESLDSYEVVQPFTNAIWLNLEYNTICKTQITCVLDKDKTVNNLQGAHVGFAWAFQRSYFNEVGMFQYDILGSGDSVSSMLFLNNRANYHSSIQREKRITYMSSLIRQHLKKRCPTITFLNGNIIHLWHGSWENRQYYEKELLLTSVNNIQKLISINKDGVFEFKDLKLNDILYKYFIDRDDDGLSLQLKPITEVKPVVLIEDKPEVKPEINPVLTPEIKPEIKPALTPEIKPEVPIAAPILSTRGRSMIAQ